MSYHILEVQTVDKEGNHIPPSVFFIVNSHGKRIEGPFSDLSEALDRLRKLEQLEKEKVPSRGPSGPGGR